MKLAALHDGKIIGFPDDAEDEHMDAAVHAYHVAAGKAEAPQDQGVVVLQQLATQIAQMQGFLSEQLAEMRQHDEHANQKVVAALTAPKKIVHDKDGRPVGVTVGN